MVWKGFRLWVCAIFCAAIPLIPLNAENMREVYELPLDCAEFIPPATRGTTQPWQVFVKLEHCDRMKRLRRLSEVLPIDQQPQFFEGIVPASRLPSEFGVDLPVLRVVFPDRTFFDTSSTRLRPEAAKVVEIVAASLRSEPPDVTMFVSGHADRRGTSASNEILSINRADSVAKGIFAQGVRLSSIWRIGFGEDMPLYSGDTPRNYARNRRVEFLFAAKPEAVAMWLADQQFGELCRARNAAASNSCRAALRFRDDYEAVKVRQSSRASRTNVRRQRKPASVNATRKARTKTTTKSTKRVEVIPASSNRIKIDPVNPHSTPVRVTL